MKRIILGMIGLIAFSGIAFAETKLIDKVGCIEVCQQWDPSTKSECIRGCEERYPL